MLYRKTWVLSQLMLMIQTEQNWLFFIFNEIKKLLNETSKSSNNEKNSNLSLATDKDVEFAIESH